MLMKTFSESAKIYAASVAEEPVPNKIERQNLFFIFVQTENRLENRLVNRLVNRLRENKDNTSYDF